MNEAINLLSNYQFMQYAVIACLLASIGCGIIGSYVVVKRISSISAGIAHSVLAGMGIAYFFGASPMHGAIITAIIAAMIIGWINLKWKQQEDVLIAAIWSAGMAIGIIFLSKTPGYNVDLFAYLFGNILLITDSDLILMLVLDIVIISVVSIFYQQILLSVFDEEFARIRGINVEAIYYLLFLLIALTVVLLIQVVGLILVICLLSMPAATAALFTKSLKKMMIVACLIALMVTWLGLAVSYQPDLPAASVMVLIACSAYFISLLCRQKKH